MGARASCRTCSWTLEMDVGPTETPCRKVFYRSLPFFMVVDVVHCDVAGNAGLTGVPGMPLALVPSTSFAAGMPIRADTILLMFKPFFPDDLSAAGAACALAIMMVNAVLACHTSRCLLPYRVMGRNQSTPSVVFLMRLAGWLKRSVTLCFATRKRLNSSVPGWVLLDPSRIPVSFCMKPVRR